MTRRVLFADDSSRIRMLLRAVLQGDDHIVLEATNGHEALELLHMKRPDIAILDVSMPALEGLKVTQPKLDGLDVCRAARADPNLIGLKIIVISAHAEAADALAAGADRFLGKPFHPSELLAMIDDLSPVRR